MLRMRLVYSLWVCVFGFFCALAASPVRAAPVSPDWQPLSIAAGLPVETGQPFFCFDSRRPDLVYYPVVRSTDVYAGPSFVVNMRTGLNTVFSPLPITQCGSGGVLYSTPAGTNLTTRFTQTAPQGTRLAHTPTRFGQDGTEVVYSLDTCGASPQPCLYVSVDTGLSWQERALPAADAASVSVAPTDARILYLLASHYTGNATLDYRIFASFDAGTSWQQQDTGVDRGCTYVDLDLRFVPQTTILEMDEDAGCSAGARVQIARSYSNDGGRTFTPDGPVFGTAQGLLQLTLPAECPAAPATAALSADGARSWHSLPPLPEHGCDLQLFVAPGAPANLFLRGNHLWHSPDNGLTWRDVGDAPFGDIALRPALPVTLLAQFSWGYAVRTLTDSGSSTTQPVPALPVPGSLYFAATGHTLSGHFAEYWLAHGGLPQFGYPRTEQISAQNESDGRSYTVQYFERARFEYHPDAPPAYRVMLGLLGNQLTAARTAAGDGAFTYFPDQHYPGGRYFPQTGHNLRNDFKAYWEAHGGLAIYGYPTSEEFYEKNPDDGQTYVVQYFERNRFEYHPENTGTPYVVLLGLLGNAVLREKSWLS